MSVTTGTKELQNDLCKNLELTPAQAEKVANYLSMTDDPERLWDSPSGASAGRIRLPCDGGKAAREYGDRVFPPLFGNSDEGRKKMAEMLSEQVQQAQLVAKLCQKLSDAEQRIKALEDKKNLLQKLRDRVVELLLSVKARFSNMWQSLAASRQAKLSTQERLAKELAEMSEDDKKLLVAQLSEYWGRDTAKEIANVAAKETKLYKPLGDIHNQQRLASFEAEAAIVPSIKVPPTAKELRDRKEEARNEASGDAVLDESSDQSTTVPV